MNDQSKINRIAWNYRAYEFFSNNSGTPEEYAKGLLKDVNANINESYVDILVYLEGKKFSTHWARTGEKRFVYPYLEPK